MIEAAQPYRRGDAAQEHPLYGLNDLSNRDKHRVLNATYVAPQGEFLRVTCDPGAILAERRDFIVSARALKHEAKLMWLRFDQRGADPKVKVHDKITLAIAFGEVNVGLRTMFDAVDTIVTDAEVFFL